MPAGIDYGRGTTNIDRATGIRYGVISQNSVLQAWADSSEPDYGEPTCPKCGNAVDEPEHYRGAMDDLEQYGRGCVDYVCDGCKHTLDSSDCFGEEPVGRNYSDDGYEAVNCLDSDIMILKSPFYTLAPFCSPCVPGAGNLDSACDGGVKSYCFGHDWFEDGSAPYPVYSVETNTIVPAPAKS